MKLFALRLLRFWATLQRDDLKVLTLCLRIYQEQEKLMAADFTAIETAVTAVEAKLQQDTATIASTQAALAAEQTAAAAEQTKIDALTARLNAALNPPAQ